MKKIIQEKIKRIKTTRNKYIYPVLIGGVLILIVWLMLLCLSIIPTSFGLIGFIIIIVIEIIISKKDNNIQREINRLEFSIIDIEHGGRTIDLINCVNCRNQNPNVILSCGHSICETCYKIMKVNFVRKCAKCKKELLFCRSIILNK